MKQNQKNDTCKATLDLPYPPVRAENCQQEYAYAMLSNIGSSNSEMSAVSLYFYNSVILQAEEADFARCFHEISIVEMHHLDIFSTLAFQMGMDPRLWGSENHRTCYWTPAYNRYPRNIREVLENAIQGEEAAIQKYIRQSQTICDANIVENLERILLDEKHHVELFHAMLARLA